MSIRELSTQIVRDCILRLASARLTKAQFLDVICEIHMRTIVGYCMASGLDPYEILRLFHDKNEEISRKGYEEAKWELECKMTGAS